MYRATNITGNGLGLESSTQHEYEQRTSTHNAGSSAALGGNNGGQQTGNHLATTCGTGAAVYVWKLGSHNTIIGLGGLNSWHGAVGGIIIGILAWTLNIIDERIHYYLGYGILMLMVWGIQVWRGSRTVRPHPDIGMVHNIWLYTPSHGLMEPDEPDPSRGLLGWPNNDDNGVERKK